MSIAVSLTIHPSRGLLFAARCMCFCVAVVGCAVGFGMMGHFSFAARVFIVLASLSGALFALFQLRHVGKTFRLDISAIGNIRLRQYDDRQRAGMLRDSSSDDDGESVRLMEGSTLWPGLMFLHLQSESGRMTVLRILPDSVSPQDFRALSVACRWIAARSNEPTNMNHG